MAAAVGFTQASVYLQSATPLSSAKLSAAKESGTLLEPSRFAASNLKFNSWPTRDSVCKTGLERKGSLVHRRGDFEQALGTLDLGVVALFGHVTVPKMKSFELTTKHTKDTKGF